jgi:hypothetical protein
LILSKARRWSVGLTCAAVLAGLMTAGCKQLAEMKELMTKGYMARDLLPVDREVGSWRSQPPGRALGKTAFRKDLGEKTFQRLSYWELNKSPSQSYRLGKTGRSVQVDIYDMGKPAAAFDIYSYLRAWALGKGAGGGAPQKPLARVTKIGAQGLLYDAAPPAGAGRGLVPATAEEKSRVLIFWAERFLIKMTARGGTRESSEAALVAFGEAITRKVKKPFELAEVYVLQIPGEVPNSERYVPRDVLGRVELPRGAVAEWQGKTGKGTIFASVFPSARKANYAFEKLRRACGGVLTPTYENGLFAGRLPGRGALTCFRRGTAVIGLVGAAPGEERMAALNAIRKRCLGQATIPALKSGEGHAK